MKNKKISRNYRISNIGTDILMQEAFNSIVGKSKIKSDGSIKLKYGSINSNGKITLDCPEKFNLLVNEIFKIKKNSYLYPLNKTEEKTLKNLIINYLKKEVL